MQDIDLLIDKIDFSLSPRQIAKQAFDMGSKYDDSKGWHSMDELPEHNRQVVGLTRARRRAKNLAFFSEEQWRKHTTANNIGQWAYVDDIILKQK